MAAYACLDDYLNAAAARHVHLQAVGQTVLALAAAGRNISAVLAQGPLAGRLSEVVGNSLDGDGQKKLDVMTHDIVREALARCPVAVFASEEAEAPEVLQPGAALAVAVDPLDGSSNIDTLAPVGTIFSILPATSENPEAAFLQTGRHQLAAGFLIYGPRTALALTLGDGTRIFTLDPATGQFMTAQADIKVPETTREYAINSSNFYHWEPEISAYVVELMQGQNGPRTENFNTRWLASMVADAYRILQRGGIYLYPADQRAGYRKGRLRLVYEANPVAFLMEQAGAAATDGHTPILDLVPGDIHARCPLIFGSAKEVARVTRAYAAKASRDAPLFKTRSLFRKTHALGSHA
jgi:fructose-1,6-bisphosphatase I